MADGILNGTSFTDIGVSSACRKGTFVYYNDVTGNYEPAYQQLSTKRDNLSNLTPASSMYVVGVIISPVVDGKATILTSGLIRNKDILAAIFGANTNIPGNYYLDTDGKLTKDVSKLSFPLYCGTLTDTSCFILNIQTPDFRTHNHTMYMLNPNMWVDNVYSDANLTYILNTFSEGICIVADGKVLIENIDYSIENNSIKYNGYVIPSVCIVYANNPFMGSVGWITGVNTAPGNSIINIAKVNNKAIIDTQFTVTQEQGNGIAVSSISNQGVHTATVVNDIIPGSGITVVNNNGTCTIGLSTTYKTILDFNILNANGVVFGGTDFTLIKFPANTDSSVQGSVRIPFGIPDNSKANIVLWVSGEGSDNNGYAKVRKLSISNVEEGADVAVTSDTVDIALSGVPGNSASSNAYKIISDTPITVNGGDFLSITIEYSSLSNTLSAYSLSVELS